MTAPTILENVLMNVRKESTKLDSEQMNWAG
jgi:hypothetical protein